MKLTIRQYEADGFIVNTNEVEYETKPNQVVGIDIENGENSQYYSMFMDGKLKETVGERGENYLDLHALVTHFTLSDMFDKEVLTNGRRMIVYRTSEYIDQAALTHIENGCIGREYLIERTEDKFKIVITL